MSPVIFSMAVDWFMPTVTQGRRLDIQWTLMTVLEDLDYSDDIGLLSSKQQDAQQKAERPSKTANTIGLKVNTKKTQILRKNTRVNDPVMIDGNNLKDDEEFTYLGIKLTTTSDCNPEINTRSDQYQSRIRKANQTFAMLKPAWRANNPNVYTKIKIFRRNVLSILLYGAEGLNTTVTIQRKLEAFLNKCLRRTL